MIGVMVVMALGTRLIHEPSKTKLSTSAMELLCENSERSQHVDCFRKKAPPQTSDRILNADPIRGAVNVGCGWNASAWNSWL